jgi:cell filamentation protein
LPLLDFTPIAEESKQEYFSAVQAGLDRNYEPMGRLFARVIEQSPASS